MSAKIKSPADWYHAYNGLTVEQFMEQAGIDRFDFERLRYAGWFRDGGDHPDLYFRRERSTGELQTWIDKHALERYAKGAAQRQLESERRQREARQWDGVYVIGAPHADLLKIGVSVDVRQRLGNLQMASPVDLEVLAFVPGRGAKYERQLHRVFARQRVRGEWFKPSPALLWFCERYRWQR